MEHEFEESMDDHVEDEKNTIEDTREELLEEDEISSTEEAFLKGYEDAAEDDEDGREEE